MQHLLTPYLLGSTAAQMQSQVTKQRNLEDAAEKVGSKLDTAPGTVTTEEAQLLHSRQSRAMDGQQPQKGSIASQAQSVAAANEQGATVQTNTPVNPAEQSKIDREANYIEMAGKVTKKMANEPEAVTKGEADKLDSRETKAFGATEKGGVASQAQSLASKNAGDTKV